MASHRVALLTILLASSFALAQPLADRVPADALVYIGWQGGEAMPPAYQDSHLKAVVDSSNIPALFDDFLPRALQQVGGNRARVAVLKQLALSLGGKLWKHPSALYVSGMDLNAVGGPRPRLGLLCQAGKEADALIAELQPVLNFAQRAPFPVKVLKQGELVAILIGYEQEAQGLAGPGAGNAKSIRTAPRFQQALAQVGKDPVFIAYVDGEGVVGQIEEGTQRLWSASRRAEWTRIRNEWGLSGIKALILTGGFEGRDWSTQVFVAVPTPRPPAWADLQSPPLSDTILKCIPVSCTWSSAWHMDLALIAKNLRDAETDPQAIRELEQFMAEARQMLGFDLQKDLLPALGSEWAMYVDPNTAGAGFFGLTIVSPLNKPAEAERFLTQAEQAANAALERAMQREKVRLAFSQRKIGELTVHTFSVPFVAPSWAIQNGKLYIGLFPQMVVAAATAAHGPSILENPAFQALRQRLGGQKADSFSFNDLTQTAPGAYGLLMPLSQLGLGFADLFGIKTPPLVLPPFHRIQPHLAAAGSFSWTDDAGWHLRALSPFPGSFLLSSDNTVGIGAAAMGVSILLPALNAAKERANRVKCASNLRQIGQGCFLYANDHRKYPADLGTMVQAVDLHPEVMVCPSGDNSLPAHVRMGGVAAQVQWVNQNADYVYLGTTVRPNDPAEKILAYEKIDNHQREGINLLFNDGHVEWMHLPRAIEEIRKQTGREP